MRTARPELAVGRAEIARQNYAIRAYSGALPTIGMAIIPQPGANELETATSVLAELDAMQPDFPPGVAYSVPYNPTEFVATSIDAYQLFARILCALLSGEQTGPVVMELVAPVNSRVQRAISWIPGKCNGVAQSGRKAPSIARLLIQLVGIELKDSRTGAQLGTRILSLGSRLTVLFLTRVRSGPNVQVERATIDYEVERVVPIERKSRDDRVGLPGRLQRAGSDGIAHDRAPRCGVKKASVQRNSGPAARAERLAHIGLSVVVGITKRDDGALAALSTRTLGIDEDIAVRSNEDVARTAHAVGEHGGAKSWWQLETGGAPRKVHARRQAVLRLRSDRQRRCGNRQEELHGVSCWGMPFSHAPHRGACR